jgi:plasmid replication initiation protein
MIDFPRKLNENPIKQPMKNIRSIFHGPNQTDPREVKMAVQQLPLPGEIVKKSNAIARAQWQPESIWEPRIVALVASKVRESDEDFFEYRIPVAELTGSSDENLAGKQYRDIKKSIAHLGKATIRIQGNKPRNFRQYNIFSMCGYEDGYLIARFDPDLKPHFLHLKTQFTAYNLFEYLTLPSSYSQQIFEFLKSWSNTPEVIISVAELHDLLNTPESFRSNFTDFRRWVLVKAHKDISEKTSLRYEWEAVKKGRSYVSVRFLFAPGRKALAEAEQQKVKEAKRRRLQSQRLLKAVECSKSKGGECITQDNKRLVCKVCRELDVSRIGRLTGRYAHISLQCRF